MKYTKEQAKRLKDKGMDRFNCYTFWTPTITSDGEFYIVESEMNNPRPIESKIK